MTQDEIIEMYLQVSKKLCNDTEWCWAGVGEPLQMFAKLVAAKALAQPKQKPMAWYCCFQGQEEGEFFLFGSPNSERYPSQYKTPLYEHLPQRTWVGLTNEDRYEFAAAQYGWEELLIAAEAKLKQKNG